MSKVALKESTPRDRSASSSRRKTTNKSESVKKIADANLTIDELVLNHRENARKLARSILRKWRVRMNAEEIDSIVDLTLCEAAQRYCPDKGASFMTFLFYHLRGQLVRAVTTAAQANSIFLACAQSAGIDTSDWYRMEDGPSWDFVPDYLEPEHLENETPEQSILKKELIGRCSKACDKLDTLEREIILRSFHKEEALVDIAKDLGYSRCHISRVKKSAIERLKVMMREEMNASDSSENSKDSKRPLGRQISSSRVRPLPTLAKRRARRRRIKSEMQEAAVRFA